MTKEKWQSMTDEQKTSYMRNVFKSMNFGESFDYAESRRVHERMKQLRMGTFTEEFQNPCIVLELVDPIMASELMSWMYSTYNDEGNYVGSTKQDSETAPIFGYNMIEFVPDKHSLMEFSNSEKQVLREAMRIIGEKTKKKD